MFMLKRLWNLRLINKNTLVSNANVMQKYCVTNLWSGYSKKHEKVMKR